MLGTCGLTKRLPVVPIVWETHGRDGYVFNRS